MCRVHLAARHSTALRSMSIEAWRSGMAGAGYWGDQAPASPDSLTLMEKQGCGKRPGREGRTKQKVKKGKIKKARNKRSKKGNMTKRDKAVSAGLIKTPLNLEA